MRVRKVAAVVALVAAVATPVVASVVRSSGDTDDDRPAQEQRFLQFSGGDRSTAPDASTGAPAVDAVARKPVIDHPRRDCGTSPTTPAGWCLTPAGSQFDVLR